MCRVSTVSCWRPAYGLGEDWNMKRGDQSITRVRMVLALCLALGSVATPVVSGV